MVMAETRRRREHPQGGMMSITVAPESSVSTALTAPADNADGNWVQRARRNFTPLALVASPVLIAAGFAVHDPGNKDNTAFVSQAGHHLNRWMVTHFVIATGFVLVAVGAGAVLRLARGRGSRLIVTGAVMTVIGGFAYAYETITHSVLEYALEGTHQVTPALSARIQEDSFTLGWTGAVTMLSIFSLVGMIFIVFGLVRSRQVPRWAAILLILSPIPTQIAGSGPAVFI